MGQKALSALAVGIIRRVKLMARVAVTGRVVSVDLSTSTIEVRPSVSEQDIQDGEPRTLPVATSYGVPIIFPGGKKRGFTFGLEASDDVLLVVRHRSHDEVDGGTEALPTVPKASRRMSMADAVAIPGYVPPGEPRPSSQFRSDGQPVLYMASGEALHIATATATLALARADLADAQLEQIRTLLKTWTTVPNDGGAALKIAAVALWSAPSPTTGTNRVKVDS